MGEKSLPAPRSCSPGGEAEWGKSPCPPSEGGEVRGVESIKLRADASTLHWWELAPLPTGLTSGGTPPTLRAVGEMDGAEWGKSPCPPAVLPLAGGRSLRERQRAEVGVLFGDVVYKLVGLRWDGG